MPRRWGSNARLWAYRYLVLRDGEHCDICTKIPTTRNSLDIDHKDGNKNNNDPQNLRLLCRHCNVILENKSRLHEKGNDSPSARREREEGNPSTRLAKEAVDYKGGSVEMQASFLFELDYREWVLGQVKKGGALLKKEAIFAGAEQAAAVKAAPPPAPAPKPVAQPPLGAGIPKCPACKTDKGVETREFADPDTGETLGRFKCTVCGRWIGKAFSVDQLPY